MALQSEQSHCGGEIQPIRIERSHKVIQLLIDDRERAIIEKLAQLAQDTTSQWWRAQRLTYGDYALIYAESGTESIDAQSCAASTDAQSCAASTDAQSCAASTDAQTVKTLMLIERKTFADFAQSFKDSRILNIAGLVALRAECPSLELAILVEGIRPRSELEKYNGIPYKNIRAKINHLRLRDKFHVFETRDADDTADCLRGLVSDASTLFAGTKSRPAMNQITGAESSSAIEIARAIEIAPSIATRRPNPLSIEDEVRHMFEMFPGVGPKQAAALIRAGISIDIFVRGVTIIPVKMPKRIETLIMRYSRERTSAIDRAILARMTRVTNDIADALLKFAAQSFLLDEEQGTLSVLCSLSREQLATFRYKDQQRTKLCARLWECLHYCGPEGGAKVSSFQEEFHIVRDPQPPAE